MLEKNFSPAGGHGVANGRGSGYGLASGGGSISYTSAEGEGSGWSQATGCGEDDFCGQGRGNASGNGVDTPGMHGYGRGGASGSGRLFNGGTYAHINDHRHRDGIETLVGDPVFLAFFESGEYLPIKPIHSGLRSGVTPAKVIADYRRYQFDQRVKEILKV